MNDSSLIYSISPVLITALPLTFLKTAGFGRGGPKGGTSSLAVTDTCWHKTNNSNTLLTCIPGGLRVSRMKQCLGKTWEHLVITSGDWSIVYFVAFRPADKNHWLLQTLFTVCLIYSYYKAPSSLHTGLGRTLYVVCSVQGFSTCTST